MENDRDDDDDDDDGDDDVDDDVHDRLFSISLVVRKRPPLRAKEERRGERCRKSVPIGSGCIRPSAARFFVRKPGSLCRDYRYVRCISDAEEKLLAGGKGTHE